MTHLNGNTLPMQQLPHITVATVVQRDGKFLMVKEKISNGRPVYNQPLGSAGDSRLSK